MSYPAAIRVCPKGLEQKKGGIALSRGGREGSEVVPGSRNLGNTRKRNALQAEKVCCKGEGRERVRQAAKGGARGRPVDRRQRRGGATGKSKRDEVGAGGVVGADIERFCCYGTWSQMVEPFVYTVPQNLDLFSGQWEPREVLQQGTFLEGDIHQHRFSGTSINFHAGSCRFSMEFTQGRELEGRPNPGSVSYQLENVGTSFHVYVTQFPHLRNGNNNSSYMAGSL